MNSVQNEDHLTSLQALILLCRSVASHGYRKVPASSLSYEIVDSAIARVYIKSFGPVEAGSPLLV